MSVEKNQHDQSLNSKNKEQIKSEDTQEKTNPENIDYSGLGLMVGLTTFPIDKDIPHYFENEIETLFEWYSESLNRNLQDNTILYKNCYKPKAYYLFGKFDLAFISIIDDYEICGRAFTPFNPHLHAEKSKSFDYKIIAGNFPENKNIEIQENKEKILKRAEETFLKKEKRYPFISLCTVKINNILLLKYGYTDLNRAFYKYFFDNIQRVDQADNSLRVVLVETFGASEYLFLIFSNSYKTITDVVLEIRRLTFYEDENGLYLKKNNDPNNPGYCFFEYTNSLFGFDYDLFTENLITKEASDSSNYKVKDISEDFEISNDKFLIPPFYKKSYWDEQKKNFVCQQEELISLNTRWFVKPSYSNTIGHYNINLDKSNYYRVASGLGDIIPHSRDYVPISIALKYLINEYREILENFQTNKYLEGCIVESRSHPIFKIGNLEDKKIKSTLGEFNKYKNNWVLNDALNENINETLRQLGVAKIIKNKVTKIISNYNVLANNTIMFLYFLDLTDYVKKTIIETISNPNTKLNQLNYFLKEKMRNLEIAYYNRFFQSSVTKEITDFNSEYFGAIHQTISAFSLAYNAYGRLFGDGNTTDIVTVESHPRIESSKYFVRVNYFHVFQPEIFAVICCHEATNFFFDKMTPNSWGRFDTISKKELINEYGFKNEQFTNSLFDKEKENIKINEEVYKFLSKKEDFHIFEEFSHKYLMSRSNLFKYFSKDIVTLHVGYFGDKDLFEFWHWNYFIQMPMNYDSEHQINKEKFCLFLIRILFVLSDVQGIDFISYYDNKDKNPLKAPNPILQNLWLEFYPKARWLVMNMLKMKSPNESGLAFKTPMDLKITFVNWAKQLSVYGINKKEFENNKSNYSTIYKKYFSDLVENDISAGDSFYNSIINDLKTGRVIEKNTEEPESDYYFVTKLIYAFLKYYKIEVWAEAEKERLLPRSQGNIKENLNAGNYSDVLLDRQGGLFCFDFNRRQELFKMRSTFIKSLWDINLKAKGREFLKFH